MQFFKFSYFREVRIVFKTGIGVVRELGFRRMSTTLITPLPEVAGTREL